MKPNSWIENEDGLAYYTLTLTGRLALFAATALLGVGAGFLLGKLL